MAPATPPTPLTADGAMRYGVDLAVLREIENRVLWLATRIVDAANRDRIGDGVKPGGHQSSSASLVSAMTALWFAHIGPEDRVSVKPHAAPVFHAIQYLLGNLDQSYLTKLRASGGLQAYPSRTKDPDRLYVDFSTGSVGHGAANPLFAALVRNYVSTHFGERSKARYIAIIGDAELDEGNVWEAVAEPATQRLGSVTWIVDFNRQSLDRVIPGVRIAQWRRQFAAAGWHVITLKYGPHLRAAFRRPFGSALRQWLDEISNEQYQATFGLDGLELRRTLLEGAPGGAVRALADVCDDELAPLVHDLGGHDLAGLIRAYRESDANPERPSVIFAYTVKGWRLPFAGRAANHSALLSPAQVEELRIQCGVSTGDEWARIDLETPAGRLASRVGETLNRSPRQGPQRIAVPDDSGENPSRPISTQEAFGSVMMNLGRLPAVAPYLVTVAADVARSTGLGGFINRVGIFATEEKREWRQDGVLRWRESPGGQHIELGISEMNLFALLGQLGLAWDLSDQKLLPVGTVYDPFICRGLDALINAVYSGASFIIVGSPSGVTLAPEGGAHQSAITPSIGLELPNTSYIEPAYARAVDWLLCDALRSTARGDDPRLNPRGASVHYFRLSTRPIDQAPFRATMVRLGEAQLREQVLAGGYRLIDASELEREGAPSVSLAACGAVLPEVIAAAEELKDEGIAAHVIDVPSPDRLYASWRDSLREGIHRARRPASTRVQSLFAKGRPIVTVHDAASHALAWLGSAACAPCVPLGVDQFGESGSVSELYSINDLLPGHIVNAALAALSL